MDLNGWLSRAESGRRMAHFWIEEHKRHAKMYDELVADLEACIHAVSRETGRHDRKDNDGTPIYYQTLIDEAIAEAQADLGSSGPESLR